MYRDVINLVRAAHIVRKDIFEKKYDFNGSITNHRGNDSVLASLSLHALVRMLLEGPNIEHQSHGNKTKVILSRGASDVIRHNKERKAPSPIYLSTLIHAKTR